jgi:putative ABC transport system permease protein
MYRVRSIAAQSVDEQSMDDAMVEIDTTPRCEHRLRPEEQSDFNIRDQASLLTTMQRARA